MSWLEEIVVQASMHLQPWVNDTNKRMGRELELFRRKDFSPMAQQLATWFPNSKDDIRLANVSISSKVASDGAGQFIDTPLCEYSGASEVQHRVLEELLAELDVNQILLMAERQCVLQHCYLLGLWPDSFGRLRLNKFLPYQIIDVEWDDPWAELAGDVALASRVVLAVAMSKKSNLCMRVELTRDMAWCRLPNGKEVGLFNAQGTNPLGRVPCIGTRREESETGFVPIVAQDVHSCQIGLILGLSDVENILRNSTVVALFATGEGAGAMPKTIPLRAGQVTPIKGQVTVTPVHQTPATNLYMQGIGQVMKLLTQFRNLRPQGYEAAIVTGVAANIDLEGFLEERRTQEQRCERVLQGLANLAVDVHNASGRALRLAPMKVKTTWRYIRSEQNILQEAQSKEILIRRHLWSEIEEVAMREGISRNAAMDLIEKRATKWGMVLPAPETGPTPGLDKLADRGPGRPTEPLAQP